MARFNFIRALLRVSLELVWQALRLRGAGVPLSPLVSLCEAGLGALLFPSSRGCFGNVALMNFVV